MDRLHKNGTDTIPKLKAHFARHMGSTFFSDNGPPFNSHQFPQFAEDFDFMMTTSSPHYPQSKRKAENAVKQAKRLLIKCATERSDPLLALLEQRNIPEKGLDSSPVQRLFGGRTRTLLSISPSPVQPQTRQV